MTSRPGLYLSFDEIVNLRTFEDICQYANWPQNTIPPLSYSSMAPEVRQRWIRLWIGGLIATACDCSPWLREELDKLQEKEKYIDTENLKVYLSLKVPCSEWVNWYISKETIGNILIPEIQHVLNQVEEYIKEQPSPYNPQLTIPGKAFNIGEKAHPDFGYASADLCKILEQYHRQFLSKMEHYLSPYTSIVAPSGTGKSYTVSQLAVKHNKYVIYLNFAPEYHRGYPGRSSYASLILQALNNVNKRLPFLERRNKMEWIWSIVIWALLRLARSAWTSGMSADAFFRLQIGEGDVGKQDVIESALQFAINQPPFPCLAIEVPNPKADWQAFDDHCKNAFTTPGPQEMTNDDANSSIQPLNLEFIICIDEARNLLGGP
ncbi:5-oxoprolinase (ATP-hydrolyzing) [Ceratocystis lukuohia]|uniref:5-oxoprolinase (ATP-hydrolyzing) n=1 Tax=Ceratocystis lukuohia TaxID=2019550 RepID=A0ABR4MQU8_9PEZI